MGPVLEPEPEKEPPDTVATTFRASRKMVVEIDQAAASKGLSRNKAILKLLRFALDEHKKDAKPKKK